MIQLIKKIEGNFVTEVKGVINYIGVIQAEIQREDYVNIYGLTAFLQNLSQTPKTESFVIPNLFGYSIPVGLYQQTVAFNTCNNKSTWYNMQESPDYVMGLSCGLYPGPSTFTLYINSLTINGIQHITTPKSILVDSVTANWVPANNNIVSGCTGTTTGWTYTDFVDFLNYTFVDLGVSYRAQISLVEVNLNSSSNNGFYLIYPENDVFTLSTSSDSGNPIPLVYNNSSVNSGGYTSLGYYKSTDNVNYDCETNIITE